MAKGSVLKGQTPHTYYLYYVSYTPVAAAAAAQRYKYQTQYPTF